MTQSEQAKTFKICLVTISLAGGGAERSCAMHSQMLSEIGHQVHTVVLNDKIDFSYKGTLFNLGKEKDKIDTLLKRIKRFKKFKNYLLKENFDIIIDHRSKNNYLRELYYDKYIYKNETRWYVIHSSNIESYFTKSVNKMVNIYNKNSINIAVSKYIKNQSIQTLGVKKCTTIYNAFDEKWNQTSSEIPLIIKNKTYILSYGRIDDEIKDLTFLINSFEKSNLWKQDVFLVIMGDGRDKKYLKGVVARSVCFDNIIFLPFVKNPFSIIQKAKFVTLTSKYEGFPMVLVESLSMGTPVVSLDIVSGPSEIIKHKENGLLIKKREVPLFAEALQLLITDIDLYNHCKNNTKISVEQFSKEKIAKQWNKLLQNEIH